VGEWETRRLGDKETRGEGMPGKITLSQFQAVCRMRRAGMRQVEIARELGLSVWTVAKIADERRFLNAEVSGAELPEDAQGQTRRSLGEVRSQGDPGTEVREAEPGTEAREVFEADLPEDDGPPDYVAANLRRCAGCGAMVYVWPCIACQMATMTQRVPPAAEVEDDPEEVRRLTEKQRRWRRKRIRELVFGE
jgi:hypothetical protein